MQTNYLWMHGKGGKNIRKDGMDLWMVKGAQFRMQDVNKSAEYTRHESSCFSLQNVFFHTAACRDRIAI